MEVVPLHGPAQDPDVVLKEAMGQYQRVVVLGYGHDGLLDLRASTNLTDQDILWLLECAKLGPVMGLVGVDPDQ